MRLREGLNILGVPIAISSSNLNLHRKCPNAGTPDMNADHLSSYLKLPAGDPRVAHSPALKLGLLLSSTFLTNNLINSYLARSNTAAAHHLFGETPHPNVITWSSLISAHARSGNLHPAILLLRNMQSQSQSQSRPNHFTFGSLLTGCARARDSTTGSQIHSLTVKYGYDTNTFIAGALIDMYAKCGEVKDSWRVFDQTPVKDVVSWTAMITCLANSGECRLRDAAFGLFKDMLSHSVWPVVMTFASLVKIFDEPSKLECAKQVHGCMVKAGIEVDDHLGSSLIAMYGRCGGVDEAVRLSRRINNDVVSWTSLLVAHVRNGYYVEAICIFRKMIEKKVAGDSFVVASVIGACSALEDLAMGKEIHGHAVKSSFVSDVSVANALITLYGRCGEIGMAERVFRVIRGRDDISWTAMLTCYSQNDRVDEAFSLFQQMLKEAICPSIFSITGVIRACSTVASLCTGEQMHSMIVKMGIDDNLSVENSLITMYAKSGSIASASRIFNSMAERDLVSWNALITGFSQHGFERETLELFEHMQKARIRPDDYTFTGLLVSCSRAGLVAEGCEYFRLMNAVYGLEPTMEHYACMVDLFGRTGNLHNAVEFVNSMPCEPDFLVFEALLSSCKVHGNVELAEFTTKKILEMRPKDPSPYITLASIHASDGKWDRKAYLRDMIKDQGVEKKPGISWVESHV